VNDSANERLNEPMNPMNAMNQATSGRMADPTNDPMAEWDAAYVIGALSPAERRAYEAHLQACARCQASVAELAGMPALLAAVTQQFGPELSATSPDAPVVLGTAGVVGHDRYAPKDLLGTLLQKVRRRRQRRIFLGAVVAASVAVAGLAVGVGIAQRSSDPQRPAAVVLEQAVPNRLRAQVQLVKQEWGTQLYVKCQYLTWGPTGPEEAGHGAHDVDWYALVVTDAAGHHESVATWSARPGTTVEPVASTSMAIERISSLQIVGTGGVVLLQHKLSG